tara:strand:+ start:12339 stop:13805 length:1467 start_codon:yes stop_codon:yes gene_type:complete
VLTTELNSPDYPGAQYDQNWQKLTFPQNYRNPIPKKCYHLVIIGAGPAGLITAITASGLGAKVALIEQRGMGGDCLNVGCVPSKALLEFTKHKSSPTFNDAFSWMRQTRNLIARHDSVERYVKKGVDVFLGTGSFLDEKTIKVGEQELTTQKTLIATGSNPKFPHLIGLSESHPLTNESVFNLTEPPKDLAILGAGPVGCELSQALSRLGIKINLFEIADKILSKEHPKASDMVTQFLLDDGVQLFTGTKISEIKKTDTHLIVCTDKGKIRVEKILVAAGRQANINSLGIESIGIELRNGLIAVDNKLRTTNPKVFAAGDVCSQLQYTHNADSHARIVVQNSLFAPTATTDKLVVPHCTYTNPEVASVGETQETLTAQGVSFDTYNIALGDLDRSQTRGDRTGFVEVLTSSKRDNILGATIVARDAGEQIASICVAMANNIGLRALGKAVIPYPTRGEYLKRLADTYNRKRITPIARKLLNIWFQKNE